MVEDKEQVHLDGDKARAGVTPHMTRYILAISLALVIVIFGFLFLRPLG